MCCPGGCSATASHSVWHRHSWRSPLPVPRHALKQHQIQHQHVQLRAVRSQAVLAGSSCVTSLPASNASAQQAGVHLRATFSDSNSSPCRCSSLPKPGGSAARQRLVRTGAASLALVDPTTAATAAVAASAAVTAATSFSFSKVVAVVLGYAVMVGSLFRSVPQIIKVLQHGSTEGLSLTSYIVELCCYSVTIAYNISQGYGFNTFGEVCACWAQDIVLIALIFRFSNTKKWMAALTGIGVSLGCIWLLSPTCPRSVLAALQASNILTMALGSRLPQIILNMRRGNAGVLSVTTCLLNVAGNAARVFTTIVLTGDVLMLGGYLSQGTLNSILLCQSIGTARQRRRAAAAAAGQADVVVGNPVKAASGPDSGAAGAPAAGGLLMQPAT